MMTTEELTAAENDFARTYYGVAFAELRPDVQLEITTGLQKNAEREEREERERVTPNIGITPEEFHTIALDACYRAAGEYLNWDFYSIDGSIAPATRAAIALGLRNTLREIEARATDEARVLEGKFK